MRYPVDIVSVMSRYGQERAGGVVHWGVDLGGAVGTVVKAPEAMRVVRVWRDDASPPFVGYGPGGVLGQASPGRYHLLAHLDPASLPQVGQDLVEGSVVGRMGAIAGPHVHWEIRREPIDSPTTRGRNTVDPMAAVAGGGGWLWLVLMWWLLSRR